MTITRDTVQAETVYLLPNDIKTSGKYNVHPFPDDPEEEERRVEDLATTIEEVGQLDDCIIDPDHVLIAGHRRRRAAILINSRRSPQGRPLLKLRCRIDKSGGDLRRKAIISNIHRKEITPMELALLVRDHCRENGWDGPGCVTKAAAYFKVSASTIQTGLKLLDADKEIQQQVHRGTLSATSALKIIRSYATPEARQGIVERAREIQQEEATDRALERHEKQGGRYPQRTVQALQKPQEAIAEPSVRKALREKLAQEKRDEEDSHYIPLDRAELLESFQTFLTNDYPVSVQEFVRYLEEKYAAGKGDRKIFRKLFERMIRKS